MPKLTHRFTVACLGLCLSIDAFPQTTAADQQAWLLEQVRLGEATSRDDLVSNALARLYRLSPDNLEGRAAELRLAVRQGDMARAERLLQEIKAAAPGSATLSQAQLLLDLSQPKGQQALQQARLLAAAGRLQEAVAAYDRLFKQNFPTVDLALEYWRVRSRLPDGAPAALAALQKLDQASPHNGPLRLTLANLLFAVDRDEEALTLLDEMANEPSVRNAAASRTVEFLRGQPVDGRSMARWDKFMQRFVDTPARADAVAEYEKRKQRATDPAWQAGQRGLTLLERGRNEEARQQFQIALRKYPDEADFIGGMGLVYSRTGQHEQALAYFERAKTKEQNSYRLSKWTDLIESARMWRSLSQADAALKAGQLDRARSLYQQAHKENPRNIYALIGLGDVALAAHDRKQAQDYYQQARRTAPNDEAPVRALMKLYEQESPQKMAAYWQTLPPAQQARYADVRAHMLFAQLDEQADAAVAAHDWPRAVALLRTAVQQELDNPWLTYRLARAEQQLGDLAAAHAAFNQLLQRQGKNPTARYAHALFLDSLDQDEEALHSLQQIDVPLWDNDMRALAQRLERQRRLAYAESLRADGREAQAVAYLEKQADDTEIQLRLADWAQARGDFAQAHARYSQILKRDPNHFEARLGQIETWVAQGDLASAREALNHRLPELPMSQANMQRRLADAWAAVGEQERAQRILEQLVAQQSTQDALLYRDTARVVSSKAPQPALNYYAQAMEATGLLSAQQAQPRDDEAFTRATRANNQDDWLRRSIRADAETLYQQQSTTVTLHNDFWFRHDGTPGISNLNANNTILQANLPYQQGQFFARAEQVFLNAGRFDTDATGVYDEQFGTCYLKGCRSDVSQRASGTGLAAGWHDDRTEADLGLTPLGFKVVDLVGGLSHSGKLGVLGWGVSFSRRAMANSLLSYAGTRDPNTGVTWGGVRATGLKVALNYDQGGPDGVWSSASFDRLNGKNVEDNQRWRLMAGYYRKLIHRANKRLTLGLTGMIWHYDKDLSGYTLGNGGYYSPQQYYSLSVPLSYAWRNQDWSLLLQGSGSWSYAQTNNSPLYPLKNLVPIDQPDRDGETLGSSSSGFGYTARAIAERRLSSHMVLGAGIDIQKAKDYNPSRAMLYLRYTVQPWQGNLPLSPTPLVPSPDF
jgi:tetratricopeptide (TPR) repeat protein